MSFVMKSCRISLCLLLAGVFFSGCAYRRQILSKDLIITLTKGNDIVPGMDTIKVRYRGVSVADNFRGHSIIWQAPGGLAGFYRFNDPSDGAVYGSGNWQEEWKKAMEDNIIYANEVSTVYYRIGTLVDAGGGRLQLVFPNKTRLIFTPPKMFCPSSYSICIELPEVPPKADSRFYKTK